jgi:hypothetical protein
MHFAIGTGAFAQPKTYSSLLPPLEHPTTLHALVFKDHALLGRKAKQRGAGQKRRRMGFALRHALGGDKPPRHGNAAGSQPHTRQRHYFQNFSENSGHFFQSAGIK